MRGLGPQARQEPPTSVTAQAQAQVLMLRELEPVPARAQRMRDPRKQGLPQSPPWPRQAPERLVSPLKAKAPEPPLRAGALSTPRRPDQASSIPSLSQGQVLPCANAAAQAATE